MVDSAENLPRISCIPKLEMPVRGTGMITTINQSVPINTNINEENIWDWCPFDIGNYLKFVISALRAGVVGERSGGSEVKP